MLLFLSFPAHAQRVASLNLCTDQYLLALAPERAVGVTFLALDPSLSALSDAAAAIPPLRADAEAVLATRPDLVLAGPWGARATLAALERRGVRVERLAPPEDFAAIRTATRRMGALLGAPARAEALLAGMEAGLPAPTPRGAAIFLEPRGLTAGPGTLRDAVLRAAGHANATDGIAMTLEALARAPATLLVTAPPPPTRSRATDFLVHPALAHHRRREIPAALTVCGGPWTARAVALLAQ